MPTESSVDRPPSELDELRNVFAEKPPINNLLGYHEYTESEFEQGAGRCDKCGGGPEAKIHQRPIDHGEQLKRIADGLDRVADEIEKHRINMQAGRVSNSLERIADEMEYARRVGAFWRAFDWVKNFFAGWREA